MRRTYVRSDAQPPGCCEISYCLHATGPLGAGALPGSCGGADELTVTGYVATSVLSRTFRLLLELVTRSIGALVAQVLMVTRESVLEGCGSEGTEVSTLTKLKALVRSPTAERRQEDRLGTSAPKRVSRKRRSEVWSKVP
jgi:hypothetical protein